MLSARRILAILLATAGAVFVLTGTAFAADEDSGGVIGFPDDWLSTDAANITKIIGLFLPVLVTLVTKRYSSQAVKRYTLLVISALAGTLIYLVAPDGGYDLEGFVNAFLSALIPAFISYHVWWASALDGLSRRTADVGIGTPARPVTDGAGRVGP